MLTVSAAMLLALSLQSGVTDSARPPREGHSRTVLDSVVAAELRFFEVRERAQLFSDLERIQAEYTPPKRRMIVRPLTANDAQARQGPLAPLIVDPTVARGCGFNGWAGPGLGAQIMSRIPGLPMCPHRLTNVVPESGRDLLSWDRSLRDSQLGIVRAARASLLTVVASAVKELPTNDFLVGQLVRFLIEQQEYDSARLALGNCRASQQWCALLVGFLFASRGDFREADSSFRTALALMLAPERCQWSDVRPLLDSVSSIAYEGMSCEQRAEANERLWWLADPLLLTPGNERRVEHYARKVLIALHASATVDEYFDWRTDAGGDAVAEMLLRYGWPSLVGAISASPVPRSIDDVALQRFPANYASWARSGDRARVGDVLSRDREDDLPHALRQGYSPGRVHLVPPLAGLDRTLSVAADWLVATDTGADAVWPRESFRMPHGLVQLANSQQVMLRRNTGVLLAVATALDPIQLQRQVGDTVSGVTMLLSNRPDSVQVVSHVTGIVGQSVVVRGLIPPEPALAGVEFVAGHQAPNAPSARLRFTALPPPSLAEMRVGEIDVSNPILFRSETGADAASMSLDAVLSRMSSTVALHRGQTVGVYWETYGIPASAESDLGVWIERYSSQGLLRRVGTVFGVTQSLNTPVATSWHAPAARPGAEIADGRVPIVGRAVSVDVSHLPAGLYWLEVAAALPGGEPVHRRIRFSIE
jgi:hypothetical protein